MYMTPSRLAMEHAIESMKDSLNKPADYWYWLARPDVGTEDACLLIANIQPGSLSEQCLSPRKKSLLVITRSLVSESGIERLPALGWLRWAVEHKELLTDYGAEKEQLQKILRAVDRNSDQLRQQLEQERARRVAAEQHAEQDEVNTKPSYPLAIAGLLELLLDVGRPRYNQGSAIDEIGARHPDWRGSSASQLTKLFAEAKAAAKEADKVAQAKAEARQAASKAEAR
ncbi:hypothetical protein [Azotobacter beijerinckii]|uniref:hypothetical protein n=1 Tax=Azotobacter beijerinckii TaxID=170623 RepID=UPI001113CDD6|nr:hypothetical protein [Azotobacter beijerinckii]